MMHDPRVQTFHSILSHLSDRIDVNDMSIFFRQHVTFHPFHFQPKTNVNTIRALVLARAIERARTPPNSMISDVYDTKPKYRKFCIFD